MKETCSMNSPTLRRSLTGVLVTALFPALNVAAQEAPPAQ
jgi:hypothetical protein